AALLATASAKSGIKIILPKANVGDLDNPCATHSCRASEVCINQQVACFVAPCYPVASCVAVGKNTLLSAL
ncbi:hypothetical protein DL89DRAFT_268131, partial [Linderina pennispora]